MPSISSETFEALGHLTINYAGLAEELAYGVAMLSDKDGSKREATERLADLTVGRLLCEMRARLEAISGKYGLAPAPEVKQMHEWIERADEANRRRNAVVHAFVEIDPGTNYFVLKHHKSATTQPLTTDKIKALAKEVAVVGLDLLFFLQELSCAVARVESHQ